MKVSAQFDSFTCQTIYRICADTTTSAPSNEANQFFSLYLLRLESKVCSPYNEARTTRRHTSVSLGISKSPLFIWIFSAYCRIGRKILKGQICVNYSSNLVNLPLTTSVGYRRSVSMCEHECCCVCACVRVVARIREM